MSSLVERDSSSDVDADVVPRSPDETTFLISHRQPGELSPQDVERRGFGLPKRLWRMAPVWLLGIILMYEDSQLISAGYTKIGSTFHDQQHAALLIESYIIVVAVSQLNYSRLSDVFGRMLVLLTSYGFFAAGVVICFSAFFGESLIPLVVGRGIVGLGAAGMHYMVSIILNDTVKRKDRAFWLGVSAVCTMLGSLLGGTLAGPQWEKRGWSYAMAGPWVLAVACALWSWRNLDILGAAVFEPGARPTFRNQQNRASLRAVFDYVCGILLFLGCVGCLCAGLTFAGDGDPWYSPKVYVLLLVSGVSTVAFGLHQWSFSKMPLIRIEFLLTKTMLPILVSTFVKDAAVSGFQFAFPWYSTSTMEWSRNVAWLSWPWSVGLCAGSFAAHGYISTKKRYWPVLVVGQFACTVAALMMWLRWESTRNLLEVMLYNLVFGIGSGATIAAMLMYLLQVVEKQDRATMFGAYHLATSISDSAVTASSNYVMLSSASQHLSENLARILEPEEARKVTEFCLLDQQKCTEGRGAEVQDAVKKSFIEAESRLALCVTIAAAIALIVILFFAQDLEVQDEEDEHEHGHEEATADRDRNSFGDTRGPRRAGSLLH